MTHKPLETRLNRYSTTLLHEENESDGDADPEAPAEPVVAASSSAGRQPSPEHRDDSGSRAGSQGRRSTDSAPRRPKGRARAPSESPRQERGSAHLQSLLRK